MWNVHVGIHAAPKMAANWVSVEQVTIDILPDDVLLDIYNLYREDDPLPSRIMWWKPLVDVCKRWRHLIFASPQSLRLKLLCSPRTPVRESLDIWPPLPMVVRYQPTEAGGEENVIAALKHRNRVSEIRFERLTSSVLERFAAMMQEPLPALTCLRLHSIDLPAPVLPDTFLGGSAPCLQTISLAGTAYPALPKLVLSASHLVELHISDDPMATKGAISPDVMAACLAALPNLGELSLKYLYSRLGARPAPSSPLPLIRAILPSLTKFVFVGTSEYLEDLVARIDVPLLDFVEIAFLRRRAFDVSYSYILPFINRTEQFKALSQAFVVLRYWSCKVTLGSPTRLSLEIRGHTLPQPIAPVAQLCNELSPLLSHVESLEISEDLEDQAEWMVGTENTPWLELFRPFSAVRNLFVSKGLQPFIARVLRELNGGEREREALPALRRLFVGRPSQPGSLWEVREESFLAVQ